MKRIFIMIAVMFILLTGKVQAIEVDNFHTNDVVWKDMEIFNGEDFVFTRSVPVYITMYNYHNQYLQKQIKSLNSNYEYDSPYLSLPNSKYSYYDELGYNFYIQHPQIRPDVNRNDLHMFPVDSFDDMSALLYKYDSSKNGNVVDYIRYIFDIKAGNVLEYHNYIDINMVKVYFNDLSYIEILYDDQLGITYCEYKVKMTTDEAQQLTYRISKYSGRKSINVLDETDNRLFIEYISSSNVPSTMELELNIYTNYMQYLNEYEVVITFTSTNPKVNITG